MDSDIQFGELEETPRQCQLRPDQNHHFVVVACGVPEPGELPVFVDIDVMREMESHARSNTRVELGGVLLGGQYEDDEGNPFVVITDSLRAEHYEATKGSFKFTHETWSDITRRREGFPDSTQMVGWYHTHPGWGVFLSGMDTFICEHFFDKPLDVALVIDPCQSDRAFFEWTSEDGVRRTRAVGGFYLTASRFRLPELEIFAAQLAGTIAMPRDTRYGGIPATYPPAVQVAESRQLWLSIAVLGMLLMQFTVLALIAWRMLVPPDSVADAAAAEPLRTSQLEAERELLDEIIGKLDIAPDGVVRSLEEQRKKNDELEMVALGLKAHIVELQKAQNKLEREKISLAKRCQQLLAANDELTKLQDADRARIAALKKRLEEYEGPAEGEPKEVSTLWVKIQQWKWYLAGGALLLLIAVAALFAIYGPPENGELPAPNDSPDEPVNESAED